MFRLGLKPLGLHFFLVLILFLSLFLFRLDNFANDPGLGWHLKTGEYITENLSVPKTDPFLFVNLDNPWVADQWLADTVFYNILQFGDWPLLYLVLAIYFAFTFFIYLYHKLSKNTGAHLISALVIMYSFLCASIHFICRPVLLSFLFFAITFFYLYEKSNQAKVKLGLPNVLGFGVLYCLWANIHPSFIIGLLLFGVFVLTDCIQTWSISLKARKITLLGLLVFLFTLINPAGLKLYETILFLSKSKFAMQNYSEWQAIGLLGAEGSFYLAPPLLMLILLIVNQARKLKVNWYELVVFFIFLYLAGSSIRFLPYYGIVASLLLVKLLQVFFTCLVSFKGQIFSLLKQAFLNIEHRESKSSSGYSIFLIISVFALIFEPSANKVPLHIGDFGPSKERFPYEALEYLKTNHSDASELKVLNEVNFGGFITWEGDGKVKAYIDDRTSLFRDEYYYSYMDNMTPENIFEFARDIDANFLLVENSKLNQNLVSFFKEKHKGKIRYLDNHSLLAKF